MNSSTVAAETAERAAASDRAAAAIAQQLPVLDKRHVGAAMSKLISASIGDICVVMSKAPAYKFHTLADIEWLVLPAVLAGQFYIASFASEERGHQAPGGVVTWAKVSADVDQRLSNEGSSKRRLKPEEWTSGEHTWLIDVIGPPAVIDHALRQLASSDLGRNPIKLALELVNISIAR